MCSGKMSTKYELNNSNSTNIVYVYVLLIRQQIIYGLDILYNLDKTYVHTRIMKFYRKLIKKIVHQAS